MEPEHPAVHAKLPAAFVRHAQEVADAAAA